MPGPRPKRDRSGIGLPFPTPPRRIAADITRVGPQGRQEISLAADVAGTSRQFVHGLGQAGIETVFSPITLTRLAAEAPYSPTPGGAAFSAIARLVSRTAPFQAAERLRESELGELREFYGTGEPGQEIARVFGQLVGTAALGGGPAAGRAAATRAVTRTAARRTAAAAVRNQPLRETAAYLAPERAREALGAAQEALTRAPAAGRAPEVARALSEQAIARSIVGEPSGIGRAFAQRAAAGPRPAVAPSFTLRPDANIPGVASEYTVLRGSEPTSVRVGLMVHKSGKTATVTVEGPGTGALGFRNVKELRRQLEAQHPEIDKFVGLRVTGARAKAAREIAEAAGREPEPLIGALRFRRMPDIVVESPAERIRRILGGI